MNANVFLDTNIIVYTYSEDELAKQEIARNIIAKQETVVSTQVLQETANTLFRKFKIPWSGISKALAETRQNNVLHVNGDDTIFLALQLAERYQYSFYDSLIIAAALESDCGILYSEDLHAGQQIEGLMIINPFFDVDKV